MDLNGRHGPQRKTRTTTEDTDLNGRHGPQRKTETSTEDHQWNLFVEKFVLYVIWSYLHSYFLSNQHHQIFYKIVFLQKCILALECSNMCVSRFTYNFVLQNQFLHTKFYAKNQKTKNAFLDPKKTF